MVTNLCVDNLGKRFEKRWVMRKLDFELNSGDSLVVTGRNGSGKSTLLKLIAGLIAPTEGKVKIQAADKTVAFDERRHFLGLASPELALYLSLTGLEHLFFFAEVRGLSLESSQAEAIFDKIGLGGRGGDLVSAYSTGMKQRLRMAIATMHQPPILLLDEPGSGLDEAGRKVLDELIEEQRRRGILIVATNDPDEHRYGELSLELSS